MMYLCARSLAIYVCMAWFSLAEKDICNFKGAWYQALASLMDSEVADFCRFLLCYTLCDGLNTPGEWLLGMRSQDH